MPSAPATIKDSPAGDMAPFIIFMAFVILTTVIIMSIYRINSEEDETFSGPQSSGFTITLDARDPLVFADDFLFPGFFPVSRETAQASRPNIQQDVVEVRRLMVDGEYGRAEDLLRTLFLFYPDDIESQYLRSRVLRAAGREAEAEYYDERMFFLLPSPMPDTIPSAPDAAAERTAS